MLSHTNADSHYRKGRLSGEDIGVRLLALDDRDDGKGIYQCILRVLMALMRVEAVSDSPFGATAIVQGNRAKQYGVYSELRNPRRRVHRAVSRPAPFDRHTCLRKGVHSAERQEIHDRRWIEESSVYGISGLGDASVEGPGRNQSGASHCHC